MKIYTAVEVATELRVDYKTALNLIKQGLLKALPGIRHKRITEEELNRYLDSLNASKQKKETNANQSAGH